MLKAYDYIEYTPDSSSLHSPQYFEKELEIAEGIIRQIPKGKKKASACPVCCSQNLDVFCKKWDVEYIRCDDCETIFAAVEEQELEQYRQHTELKNFRVSKPYQKEAAEKRELTWMESMDWMTFRTFRYLGKNKGLSVLDIGNRYEAYAKAIRDLPLTGSYRLEESILHTASLAKGFVQKADLVLYLNQMQQSLEPRKKLKQISEKMKPGALLFFSTRMGTGFDVLTLKEHAKIFPYEHLFLPSKKGMDMLFQEAGFQVLEYATPGRMDVGTAAKQIKDIAKDHYFIRSLMKNGDNYDYAEFQRFLQKSGMSSYAQIVAKKTMQSQQL